MSLAPIPGRPLVNSRRSQSSDSDGPQSPSRLFTVVPRFMGAPQGASSDDRLETQRSLPSEGARFEQKYSERPSAESAGPCSFAVGSLTGASSGIGADQADLSNELASGGN